MLSLKHSSFLHKYFLDCRSEWSACAALGRCSGTKCPLFLFLFFLLSFFRSHTFLQEGLTYGSETLLGLLRNKNIRIPAFKKGGILKSYSRFLNLWIQLLMGWGRSLMVTLWTRAPIGGEGRVKHAQEQGPPSAPAEFLICYWGWCINLTLWGRQWKHKFIIIK